MVKQRKTGNYRVRFVVVGRARAIVLDFPTHYEAINAVTSNGFVWFHCAHDGTDWYKHDDSDALATIRFEA